MSIISSCEQIKDVVVIGQAFVSIVSHSDVVDLWVQYKVLGSSVLVISDVADDCCRNCFDEVKRSLVLVKYNT